MLEYLFFLQFVSTARSKQCVVFWGFLNGHTSNNEHSESNLKKAAGFPLLTFDIKQPSP